MNKGIKNKLENTYRKQEWLKILEKIKLNEFLKINY